MDGITESRTLSGVVLATLGAAGYAVFRVGITTVRHLHIVCVFALRKCFACYLPLSLPYTLLLGYVPQSDG